ncbi:uncharacterized protein LOC100846396 [Brachypodium distachyon]|uniref:uncharacterized protein LOC100846396 n=1 Tax=Brachypodium distachyon TaxID=15368 RepID=UPI000234DFC4|nr:uncharacterized protein LOC100846396 [Brachypodium distachyon]|eukprot:XP_003566824.1 uncharacterized protein LOC100846396 [Brachypodium distachyon]
MGKHKPIVKSEEDINSRDKYITWTDEATKFMLEWYIDLRKDKPASFKFKKQHHLQCADALNGKFSLGVTQNQVDRHYRACKEKSGWVRRAMANSENGFDYTSCKFTISESEKENLNVSTVVNYLTKPIRFFHQLRELFSSQSHADGSLAADQTTVNLDDDGDDYEKVEAYTIPVDSDEADSDTIGGRSPRVDLDGNPSIKKRKRVTSSPHKKQIKGKANSKSKVCDDEMASSIKRLADSLVAPPVPIQPVPPADPYANIWKRINALPVTAKDKLEIAAHLSKPEQDVFRSYLNHADDALLSEWVIGYFEHRFQNGGGNGGSVVP